MGIIYPVDVLLQQYDKLQGDIAATRIKARAERYEVAKLSYRLTRLKLDMVRKLNAGASDEEIAARNDPPFGSG